MNELVVDPTSKVNVCRESVLEFGVSLPKSAAQVPRLEPLVFDGKHQLLLAQFDCVPSLLESVDKLFFFFRATDAESSSEPFYVKC